MNKLNPHIFPRAPMIQTRIRAAALIGVTVCAAAMPAHAQSASPTIEGDKRRAVSISGFGTLGVAQTNRDEAEFVVPGQPEGATRTASADPDSKLGLQVSGRFSDGFSATLQLLAKHDAKGQWKPRVEWLFAKAQLRPGVALRVGRIGAPFFAVSDFREVNYANTWTRPPLDVYGQVPISHVDGIDAIAQFPLGENTLSAQVFAGEAESHSRGEPVRLHKARGLNVTVEMGGGWSIRLGHAATQLTVEAQGLQELLAGLRQASFGQVAAMVDATRRRASFSGLGLGYDEGRLVAAAEYTRRRTDTALVPDTTAWYGSVGWRFDRLTPYLVVSRQQVDSANVMNAVPTGIDPALTALSQAVDGVVAASNTGQRTTAIGLRWDAARNVAAKAQFERVVTGSSAGQFVPRSPSFAGGARVDVVSLSVDFVF